MKKNTIVWIVFVVIIVVVIIVAAVIAMNGKGQDGSSANEELRRQSQPQTFEDGTVDVDLPEGGSFTVEDEELESVEN